MNKASINKKDFFVSVIVPNYCHSKYLDERLRSILNQTYQNFEIIILDDASPDNGASKAVIEKYRSNPHVTQVCYNVKNSGSTFKQWNKGFNLAKGELIWIAESDDSCSYNLLENLVLEFKRDNNLVLAYSLSQNIDDAGKMIANISWTRTPHGVTRLNGRSYIKRYMTLFNHCANASACLFKKDILYKIPNAYMTYKAGGDRFFWICVARNGNVAIVNKRLNFYRWHPHKVTSDSNRLGINTKELYKTFSYLVNEVKISKWRQTLIRWGVAYNIRHSAYSNKSVKKELQDLWSINDISVSKRIIMRILFDIESKYAIYI